MKAIRLILVAMLFCIADFAAAQVATVTVINGTAQAIPAVGAPRALRLGDSINQGETVATGAATELVLQFADGHAVVLVADSRLAVTTYVYDRSDASKSQVVLALIDGGMQAITGAIGKANPPSVKYLAGKGVITVQGTIVNVSLNKEVTTVTVERHEGRKSSIVFSYGSRSVTIEADKGVTTGPNGELVVRPASEILAALGNNAAGLVMKAILNTAAKSEIERALAQAIKDAGGIDLKSRPTTTPSPTGTSGSSGSGGAGGGSASTR
jgi:hypothetical protein